MKPLGTKNWSDYENMIRASLRAEGLSSSEVASVLGRSREAVSAFEHRQGIGAKQPWHPLRDNPRLLTILESGIT